jgi:hypothetical protein
MALEYRADQWRIQNMIRRILAGAAIVGVALGFSASAASATVGPNTLNDGYAVLSQFSIIDDVTVLNDVANDSIKYINVGTIGNLQNIDLDLLTNQKDTFDHHH